MLILLASTAAAHTPVIYITNTGEDWCAVANDAAGGDIVMFEAGTYVGSCTVVAKVPDYPGEQTILQSFDPQEFAVFQPEVGADHVFRIQGDRMVLLQIAFHDVPAGVDAIQIDDMVELWLRLLEFEGSDGVGVRQIGDVGTLSITDSTFTDLAHPVVFGCPGGGCVADSWLVDNDLMIGPEVGIRIGAGSPGEIRDTLVTAATTNAIHLDAGADILVDGAMLDSFGTGLLLQGGPVVVRNTIVTSQGPALQSSAGPADSLILGNTLLGAIDLPGWIDTTDSVFAGNALDGEVDLPGAGVRSNVACPDPAACFTDAAGWDLYPVADGPLRGAGESSDDLVSDWCGHIRESTPDAGAMEGFDAPSPGPIPVGLKDRFDCDLPDATPPSSTPPSSTTPSPPVTTEGPRDLPAEVDEGCAGCDVGPKAPGWLLVFAMPWVGRRRR